MCADRLWVFIIRRSVHDSNEIQPSMVYGCFQFCLNPVGSIVPYPNSLTPQLVLPLHDHCFSVLTSIALFTPHH
ncbi:hypothetical protein VTJ04DRAFT_7846 [Mycothermus thermophilus]|uniref:uncharacterized protein n=1 Tax=Humicola insolens TaxID=85995 RepID=UPI0037437AEC